MSSYLSSVRPHLLLAGLIMVLTCLNSRAQQTDNRPPEAAKTGSITGRVVNEAGQPLAGATVIVRSGWAVMNGRTTTTNLEGNFQVNGLDNALYYVNASYPAYVGPQFTFELPPPTYRTGDNVRLELVRGGIITGIVTNSSGEPVIGVRVRAFMIRDTSGKSPQGTMFFGGERSTDDRGIYRIYGLSPGSYVVQAGGGGVQNAGSPTDFDAPTFAPSSNRDTAAEIQVRSGEEATVDIRYRGEPGHIVSGTVKLVGTQGATISLVRVGDAMRQANNAYQPAGSKGFAFGGLGDGEYEVTAQEVNSTFAVAYPDISLSDPVRVTVRGADVTGLELIPKPLASIAGKITLESSKLPECQNKRQPLFNETSITAVQNRKEPVSDQLSYLLAFVGGTVPDKDGAFVIKNMRPGQYWFQSRFFARYWFVKSMTLPSATPPPTNAKIAAGTIKDAARNWTPLKSGDRLAGMTITLAEGAASIRGQIEKKETPDLRVYLVPSERDKVEDPLRYFMSGVNGDGTFSLNNLAPGRYWILAQQLQPNALPSVEKLRLPDAAEARTKIRRSAEAAKVEVELKPCQNLTDFKLNPN